MTCLATLTLAALGPWTYAGFVDDPPPPTPPSPAPAVPGTPIFASVPDPDEPPIPAAGPAPARPGPPPRPSPAPAPDPAPARVAPAAPARQSAPVLYRMPDATGQVWEHTDPAWLQTFVSDRNRQPVRSCASAPCR